MTIQAPWDPASPVPPETPKAERLEKLRSKFPKASIGKLPRATSKDARPGKCGECGGWHKLPAIHLDYVGHAEVTDRLLSVDPEWDWAPLSFTEDGMPRFIIDNGRPVGLWIKLTVCGVTRLGFGSVDGGAFDAEKQLIGDALRNAAMRFGVALDLWSKNELESNIEAPDPIAAAAADSVWDGSSTKTLGGQTGPLSASRTEVKTRTVKGLLITVPETWEGMKSYQIKGKGPYQKLTWSEVDRQPDPSAFVTWLEGVVNDIVKRHSDLGAEGRKAAPLPAEQRALLAFERLLARRAGLTEDEDDGTVPLTEEEMNEADAKLARE